MERPEASLDALIREAECFDGGIPSDGLKNSTREFLHHAQDSSSLRRQAASRLETLPPGAAAWLAVTLGTTVELGASAVDSGAQILGLFDAFLAQLPSRPEPEEALPALTGPQRELLKIFPMFCQSVVAHLARLDAHRTAMGKNPSLIDRLEELGKFGPGATWVREALLKSSGTLVVVHVESLRAYELEYVNVVSCFHLFSLIQCEIGPRLPGGRTPNPEVTAEARGQTNTNINDEAWWHYGSPHSETAHIAASIWGEASVRTIPIVNGKQVILLWSPLLKSRSWGSSFFHPHLDAFPPNIRTIRKLKRAECREWLQHLGIKSVRPWWKLW